MYQNHTSLETNRPKGPPLRGSGPLGLFYVLHFTLIFSLHSLLFTLHFSLGFLYPVFPGLLDEQLFCLIQKLLWDN